MKEYKMKNNKTKQLGSFAKLNSTGIKTTKTSKINPSFFQEEEEDDNPVGTLGYYKKQIALSKITIPLDEEIKAPSYYRHVIQGIADMGENDTVVFRINSPGGNADAMRSILTAITATDAVAIAEIYGNCHSAASFIALSCDKVHVSPHASMMIHFVSYGSAGKAYDVMRHVKHNQTTFEELFRETYEGFLTENEIEECLNGVEIWLDADEILERLIAREEYRKILDGEDEEGEQNENEELDDQVSESPLSVTIPSLDEYLIETKPKYPEGQMQQTKSESWQRELDILEQADIF